MLIGSRSKLCNLIIQQALLVKYIYIDNLDYIQYNMMQSQQTVTDFKLCTRYILRIHRRHTKVHKYLQYNSVRHLSDQPIIQRHGYTGISL